MSNTSGGEMDISQCTDNRVSPVKRSFPVLLRGRDLILFKVDKERSTSGVDTSNVAKIFNRYSLYLSKNFYHIHLKLPLFPLVYFLHFSIFHTIINIQISEFFQKPDVHKIFLDFKLLLYYLLKHTLAIQF